jgi:hypothetical protein
MGCQRNIEVGTTWEQFLGHYSKFGLKTVELVLPMANDKILGEQIKLVIGDQAKH